MARQDTKQTNYIPHAVIIHSAYALFPRYEKQHLEGGEQGTKNRIKTTAGHKGKNQITVSSQKHTAGQPPVSIYRAPARRWATPVCALAAKRPVNLYRRPLHTSMMICIFRWLQWRMNMSPATSCWAADEMSAGVQRVNYHFELKAVTERYQMSGAAENGKTPQNLLKLEQSILSSKHAKQKFSRNEHHKD